MALQHNPNITNLTPHKFQHIATVYKHMWRHRTRNVENKVKNLSVCCEIQASDDQRIYILKTMVVRLLQVREQLSSLLRVLHKQPYFIFLSKQK